MTKKFTLTVPDKLGARIEAWRSELNLSGLFQKAVEAEVERKERLKNQAREATMTEVIERLKKEKAESEQRWIEQGRKDGVSFAKSARYEDLKYAAKQYQPGAGDPTRDDVLGDYFEEEIKECPDLEEETTWDQWVSGWLEGVEAFWGEVESKL